MSDDFPNVRRSFQGCHW